MASLSQLALAPFSAAYGAAVRVRLALYRAGRLRVERVSAPVISVGNLTAGGTGKTPLVELLARMISEREGRRVCVLTRGYGRANPRRRVTVSDGAHILADAREAGDEPLLLAERLLACGASVVCDADRAAAARFALAELHAEVFILDDGFQHLRLARDLDIIALDATDPWGGGRLLPVGLLREPASGLRRADCIVITRAELSNGFDDLRAEASRLSGGRPIFKASTRIVGARVVVRDEMARSNGVADQLNEVGDPSNGVNDPSCEADAISGGEIVSLSSLPRSVAAFCGIGNPRAFFSNLKREGFALKRARSFADHHRYTQADVREIESETRRVGAQVLLTTAKDAVKLRALTFEMPCYSVEIGLEIDDVDALFSLVREAITRRI
jgi:tetraacyldisaccharide 4'-kinase